ncbi:MAG TPA: hypothetical protein ENI11_01385 [Actinobacteria bacterium]|nr:hypothetical protein [Actinomycetota bacterium]
MILLQESFFAVCAGVGITIVYFFLYQMTEVVTRGLSTSAGPALVLISFPGRIFIVGMLLAVAVLGFGLDVFVLGVSFLVSHTVLLLLTQGRAAIVLRSGRELDRKE